ncbi:MAG TPA: hypothetical protein VFM25_10220, partial [Verrucomicrobiae bacterium]|nr:hypothetical protein [Verrucomicrobiae bacterium]
MKTFSSKNGVAALTLLEIIVIIAIVAILAFMLLPATTHTNPRMARRISCVNNLKQVGLSFRLWAGDHDGKYPMQVSTNQGGTMEFVGTG